MGRLRQRAQWLDSARLVARAVGAQGYWRCITSRTPLSLDDAPRIVGEFVVHYNSERLHSAICYIAPKNKLEGRAEAILAERERKFAAARATRKTRRRGKLTEKKAARKLHVAGETEAGNAGERPARDSWPGSDEHRSGGS